MVRGNGFQRFIPETLIKMPYVRLTYPSIFPLIDSAPQREKYAADFNILILK